MFVRVAKHMTVEGGLDGEHGMQWRPLQRTRVWLTMSSACFEPWINSPRSSVLKQTLLQIRRGLLGQVEVDFLLQDDVSKPVAQI